MPDELKTQIELWKRTLAELSPDQADELEDHLRMQIDALHARSDLSASEAFTIAAMRIGRPGQLLEEFTRADVAAAWVMRLRWMVVGTVACALANFILVIVNDAVGYALIRAHTPLAWLIALRMASLSGVILIVMTCWESWMRRGGSQTIAARPPRWLTATWTLFLIVAALPWLSAVFHAAEIWFWMRLSTSESSNFAFSGNITNLVLPFTTPLILLIIARSLARRRIPSTA